MLNGIDPIIIFQFNKALPESVTQALAKIPIVSEIPASLPLPPIPIYLSENLTGLFIDTESKSVDIDTNVETLTDGTAPEITQKGISSIVSVSLTANKNSIGLSLLSAMIDLLFEKCSSREYSITYLHGATTIFRGLLQSYQVSQSADTDLLNIQFEISKGQKTPEPPTPNIEVPNVPGETLV